MQLFSHAVVFACSCFRMQSVARCESVLLVLKQSELPTLSQLHQERSGNGNVVHEVFVPEIEYCVEVKIRTIRLAIAG
ncbi:hypothetical protein CBD41_04060 [bacterium TMED181]|nr:hypothetical protein [Planctomycetota bacterium]OUW45405.1 MAG: hypothetical protein CBD41_04060 [bacterium TMED181]